MRITTILLVIFFFPFTVFASITEQGRGMLFGKDHAFFVSATYGWVLDNQSGVSQGLHMVFYPVGMTWADSPVIIYGRSVSKSEVPTVESQVERTIKDFVKKGSPNYKGEKQPSIKLPNSPKIDVYYFSGDQWGNSEAVAYYEEKDTINFLVYNARTPKDFNKHINDFIDIAKTYENIYTSPTLQKSEVDELVVEAEKHLKKSEGKKYESKVTQAAGQQMANFMQVCTSYLSNDKLTPFRLFHRINGDGTISQEVIYPSTALSVCFKGLMSDIKHPSHNFDSLC